MPLRVLRSWMTATTSKRYAGLLFLFAANLIWSGSFPATAIAVSHMSAVFLTLVRLGVGALLLTPFLKLPRGKRWDLRLVALSFVLGVLGFALPVYLETEGLYLSTPALAAIAIAMEPLFTVLIVAFATKEPLPFHRKLAIGLSLFGAWAIAGFPGPAGTGYAAGDALLVLAVVCYALYNVYSKYLSVRITATAATSATLWGGFFGTLPIWLATGGQAPHALTGTAWIALAYLAVLATTGAYALWMLALKTVPVSVAALTLYFQPVFGVLLSILIVHTRPSPFFYLGAAMILGSLYLGSRSRA